MGFNEVVGVLITVAAAAAIWPHIKERRPRRQWEKEMPNRYRVSVPTIASLTDRELLRYVDRSDYIQRELADRLEIALDYIDQIKAYARKDLHVDLDADQECCF
jgi:hypothetical protein